MNPRRAGLIAAVCLAAAGAAAYRFATFPMASEKAASDDVAAPAVSADASAPEGEFDFYVLALSWSPSYCASKGNDADPLQCGLAKKRGFTVHGLWPQYERGSPQDCKVGNRDVDRQTLRRIEPGMPSEGLARHEWRKHGTCSGLSQADYFDTMMRAFGKVRIPGLFSQTQAARQVAPAMVETAFLQANPGMPAKGFATICGGGYLSEVRICMTKDLNFRSCAEVDRRACRASSVKMPPAR